MSSSVVFCLSENEKGTRCSTYPNIDLHVVKLVIQRAALVIKLKKVSTYAKFDLSVFN